MKKLLSFVAIMAVIGFLALPLTGCIYDRGDGDTWDPNVPVPPSVPKAIEMVSIPAGTFIMGSPTTEPNREPYDTDETQHSVSISGFSISKYLVTQEQWADVMGASEDRTTAYYGKGVNYPIYYVNWYDAIVFCNKLSDMEGLNPVYSIGGSTNPADWGDIPVNFGDPKRVIWDETVIDNDKNGYRLPTEAEWEYACRAGTMTAYNTGDAISDDTGWYTGNSKSKTHEVGLLPANEWGLYDMHGNVWEWCWDWYGSYSSSTQDDPTGAYLGTYRVRRGGAWLNTAGNLRSAVRGDDTPNGRGNYIGFRLVRP